MKELIRGNAVVLALQCVLALLISMGILPRNELLCRAVDTRKKLHCLNANIMFNQECIV